MAEANDQTKNSRRLVVFKKCKYDSSHQTKIEAFLNIKKIKEHNIYMEKSIKK